MNEVPKEGFFACPDFLEPLFISSSITQSTPARSPNLRGATSCAIVSVLVGLGPFLDRDALVFWYSDVAMCHPGRVLLAARTSTLLPALAVPPE